MQALIRLSIFIHIAHYSVFAASGSCCTNVDSFRLKIILSDTSQGDSTDVIVLAIGLVLRILVRDMIDPGLVLLTARRAVYRRVTASKTL